MSASDSSVNVYGNGTVPIDVSFGTDTNTGSGVYRQRFVLGDDTNFGMLASVSNTYPLPNAVGLVTRIAKGSPDLIEIKELLLMIYEQQCLTNRLLQEKI